MKLPRPAFLPKSKDEAERMINKQTNAFLKMAEAERKMMQVFEQAIGISTVISDKWKAFGIKFIQRISKDVAYAQQNGLARAE